MVDALLESWRVLQRQGVLVDLRPVHRDRAVEVLSADGRFTAGYVVDLTGAADDVACAEAIDHVLHSKHFAPKTQDAFDFAVYWDDLPAFAAFAEEKWVSKRRLDPQALQRAEAHIAQICGPYRLRMRYRMHLAVYCKEEPF
jgi:hypothetical protein